jgi:virginiamycin B lyase
MFPRKSRHFSWAFMFAALLVGAQLSAQSSAPQAYSLTEITHETEASMFTGQPSTVKIDRCDSKELAELTIAPWSANPKGVHMIYLFDFAAHKAYTRDLDHGACSWMKYVSADAPTNYDPVTGSAQAMPKLAKAIGGTLKVLGTETINGIPAKVEGISSPGAPDLFKGWVAQKGDYMLKFVGPAPGTGTPETTFEVKQLSFAQPPASVFAAPSGCSETQGEWSDSGLNARATETVTTDTPSGAASPPSASPQAATPAGEPPAAQPTTVKITEFQLPPTGNAVPTRIAAGPDGAMWFTESNSNKIGRITSKGKITEYPIPTASATPQGITAGPDGNVWFIEATGKKVGQITTSGRIAEFPIPNDSTQPEEITLGKDGNLWFTDANNSIGRVTPAGVVTLFDMPVADSAPSCITAGADGNLWICKANIWTGTTATPPVFTVVDSTSGAVQSGELNTPGWIITGPDGALWFTGQNSNTIQRLTTSENLTLNEHIPTEKSAPFGIASGADGAVWFTEAGGNKIGRITTDGKSIMEFPVPTDSATPMGIAAGPDGALWFVEQTSNKIGRVVLTTQKP